MEKKNRLVKDRRRMEEEFFLKQNSELIKRLEEKKANESMKDDIGRMLGIDDDEVIQVIIALDINVATLNALSLIPLIEVAWADGQMDPNERKAILKAAQENNIEQGTDSYHLLSDWLDKKPENRLFEVWEEYIGAFCIEMKSEDRSCLQRGLIEKARKVATSAGGFMGLTSKISKAEEKVLERLETAFKGLS